MVDADSPRKTDWEEKLASIQNGFDFIEEKVACVACVPMSASESWLLSDADAWGAQAAFVVQELKKRPEETWGKRDDPDSGHSHQVFNRVCEGAGRPDNRETRVAIAQSIDLQRARQACPVSLEPFIADCKSG
ncbi:MAG: hypothetical protein RL367_1365 [Pseudomonadota bacterium]